MRPRPSLRSLADLHPAGEGTFEDASIWRYAGASLRGEFEALREAHAFATDAGWSIEIRDGEYELVPFEDSAERPLPNDINIQLRKPNAGRRVFFLSALAAIENFEKEPVDHADVVFVLADFDDFQAGDRWIRSWDGAVPSTDASYEVTHSDAVIDIRRGLVRDLSGGKMPRDLYRWLPNTAPAGSDFTIAWMDAAAARLMLAVASEVETDSIGALRVVLNGLRKRVFKAPTPEGVTTAQFEMLRETVGWLLIPSRDAEARHQMLVRRLEPLVSDQDDTSWWRAISPHLKEALIGARTEYRVFVTSKSAELLKTMTEVRKGVAEDVDKIVARTNRMSQAFIGGLGVLAAGLGVRVATLAGTEGSAIATLAFCTVVLFVTWCGLKMNEVVATRSLIADLRHLRRWHARLHQSLTRADYRTLAMSPVIEAVRLYNETRRYTRKAFCVAAWVFTLLVLAAPAMRGWE